MVRTIEQWEHNLYVDNHEDDDAPVHHYEDFKLEKFVAFASSRNKYTPEALYAFAINYCFGIGFLLLPTAIRSSGYIVGPAVFILTTFMSYLAVMWLCETVARAEELSKLPCEIGSKRWFCLRPHRSVMNPFVGHEASQEAKPKEDTPLLIENWQSMPLPLRISPLGPYSSTRNGFKLPYNSNEQIGLDITSLNVLNGKRSRTMTQESFAESVAETALSSEIAPLEQQQIACEEKSFEVRELCYKFTGRAGRAAYQMAISLFFYCAMTVYVQVFMSCLETRFSLFENHLVSVLTFAAVAIPCSLTDITNQIPIQAILVVLRIVSVMAMIIGCALGLWYDPWDGAAPTHAAKPYFAKLSPWGTAGLGLMFSTTLFAQMFTHSVPRLLKPLHEDHRRYARKVFSAAFFTTGSMFLAIGMLCALYFGDMANMVISANFATFHWYKKVNADLPIILIALNQLVALFPVFDVTSLFALMANTLANTMALALPEPRRPGSQEACMKKSRGWCTVLWRLLACLPPIVASYFYMDLSVSMRCLGLCGVCVSFITPAILQLRSKAACKRQFGKRHKTAHSGWHSRTGVVCTMLILSVLAGLGTFLQLIWPAIPQVVEIFRSFGSKWF